MASSDLIFPHGDNEIAIAESLEGKPLANLWLHSEVVMAGGRKVARPGGADLTLRDLIYEGHSPATVRYWLLSQHYNRVLTYSLEQMELARKAVERLNALAFRLSLPDGGTPSPELDQVLFDARSGYHSAMDNDLNFPRAQGVLFGFIKQINQMLSQGLMDDSQRKKVLDFLKRLDGVMGVMEFETEVKSGEIKALVAERENARLGGDYARADEIRDLLADRGVTISDTPHGTVWRRA